MLWTPWTVYSSKMKYGVGAAHRFDQGLWLAHIASVDTDIGLLQDGCVFGWQSQHSNRASAAPQRSNQMVPDEASSTRDKSYVQ
jgi:hypothetical protein